MFPKMKDLKGISGTVLSSASWQTMADITTPCLMEYLTLQVRTADSTESRLEITKDGQIIIDYTLNATSNFIFSFRIYSTDRGDTSMFLFPGSGVVYVLPHVETMFVVTTISREYNLLLPLHCKSDFKVRVINQGDEHSVFRLDYSLV